MEVIFKMEEDEERMKEKESAMNPQVAAVLANCEDRKINYWSNKVDTLVHDMSLQTGGPLIPGTMLFATSVQLLHKQLGPEKTAVILEDMAESIRRGEAFDPEPLTN